MWRTGTLLLLAAVIVAAAAAGCSTTCGLHQENPSGNLRNPTLRWAPLPESLRPEGPTADKPGRVSHVRYELRLFRAKDRCMIYERRDVVRPEHTVALRLAPDTVYHWTVRPRFTLDGEPRVGPWSQKWVLTPLFGIGGRTAVVPLPLELLASFRTPSR